MTQPVDLAIVGAGPAGLAAAATSAELGISCVVLDEQPEPGGQIYRSIETVAREHPERMKLLGADYLHGLGLVRALRASGADYRPGSTVWQIERDRRVFFSRAGVSDVLTAREILIATGAMERPVPVPGWTLPGVMTCGGAQILLKAGGPLPSGRVYLVGSGPLLVLLAWQLTRAGVKLAGVLETVATAEYLRAVARLPAALTSPGYLGKGLRMLRELHSAGVPSLRGVSGVALHGDDRVRELEYRQNGNHVRVPADVVLLHQGVVPNANLGLALRAEHVWDDRQRAFRPQVDPWGASSIEGTHFAGDCAGIVGARAAEIAGRIAALQIAHRLGRIGAAERDARAASMRAELGRHLRVRPFLDRLYHPAAESLAPRDPNTIVCRCEEVTAGEIQKALAQGCPGPNQMKSFVRCGMGPCQGRLCGLTVVEMIGRARGRSPGEIGYYRIRPPIKPLTLGELAAAPANDLPPAPPSGH